MTMTRISMPCLGYLLIAGLIIVSELSEVSAQVSNRGLFVVNFFNLSTDRVANVTQVLDFSSIVDTKVRLTYPAANNMDEYITLDATNGRKYQNTITADLGVPRGEHISQNAALIVSENGTPIWVHANKMEKGTTAAMFALPLTQKSTEYFIASYQTNTSFHTGFSVAALQDGTCMEIYKVKGDNYTREALVHLDKLDVYSALDNALGSDYTGYYVNSTRPISVLGGHECANIPLDVSYCDAIVEQLPPVHEWGTEHIIGPIGGRTKTEAGYEFRVVAMDNDTEVTYFDSESASPNISVNATIDRGEFVSGAAARTTSNVYLKCSKKCLVTQYNRGKSYVSGESLETDPFMMLIPPLDHYDKEMKFTTMQHYEYGQLKDSVDYLTIVAKTSAMQGFQLNGTALAIPNSQVRPVVATTDWSTAYVRLPIGYHTLTNTDSTQEYMGWVSGNGGSNTAYGYVTAYKITGPPVVDSSLYNVVEPTTAVPVVTQEPWILGNWTEDFSISELPQYGIRYSGTFSSINRQEKMIETTCSNGYQTFFKDKRLKTMADWLTSNIDNTCPGLQGSTVQLTSKDMFVSLYTKGTFGFIITIVGAPTTSFRQVQNCAREIKKKVAVWSNWPPVTTQVPGQSVQTNNPTTRFNFLQIDGDKMKDCESIKYGITDSERELKVETEAWICNGKDPEDILKIISGCTKISPVSLVVLCVLLLFSFVMSRW